MKRLLEEEGLRGEDERLAALLRSAPPFEVDPFRKRRVLIGVERGTPSRRHLRFSLRPAVALTLFISGTAAGAIGHHYAAPGTGFFGFSVPPSATATQPQRASISTPAVAAAPEGAASAEVEGAINPEPIPASAASGASGASVKPGAPHSGARARPESAEDASNVVEAIQALRADKDPAKAQTLLDDYLKTHPRGVLSGDALALSIEAASARNDPRAADYARRYLATYPKGKYRDLAKRALDQR
ncbi:MAG: hypothetical protein ABIQ16_27380 [Polyangiaceae bacterium]